MSYSDWERLYAAAQSARQKAYAPYSRLSVGAALACGGGAIVTGCNVENVSLGLTVCAERNAIGAMVVQGLNPHALAIVADSKAVVPPCGTCRQVLAEFAAFSFEIRSRVDSGAEKTWTLEELLPHAFKAFHLL